MPLESFDVNTTWEALGTTLPNAPPAVQAAFNVLAPVYPAVGGTQRCAEYELGRDERPSPSEVLRLATEIATAVLAAGGQCPAREGDGVNGHQCEREAGHSGNHACPEALRRFDLDQAKQTFRPLLVWRSNLTDHYGDDLVSLLLHFVSERTPDPRLEGDMLALWERFRTLGEDLQVEVIEHFVSV